MKEQTNIYDLLIAYRPFVGVIIVVIALILLGRIFDLGLGKFGERLLSELRDMIKLKWTIGSINAFGIMAVLILGVLVLGVKAFEWFAEWLTSIGRSNAAEIVSKSGDSTILLGELGVVAILSIAILSKTSRNP